MNVHLLECVKKTVGATCAQPAPPTYTKQALQRREHAIFLPCFCFFCDVRLFFCVGFATRLLLSIVVSNCRVLLDQNFLFTSKEEDSTLKAIDFGLSDFVKPGVFYLLH